MDVHFFINSTYFHYSRELDVYQQPLIRQQKRLQTEDKGLIIENNLIYKYNEKSSGSEHMYTIRVVRYYDTLT